MELEGVVKRFIPTENHNSFSTQYWNQCFCLSVF